MGKVYTQKEQEKLKQRYYSNTIQGQFFCSHHVLRVHLWKSKMPIKVFNRNWKVYYIPLGIWNSFLQFSFIVNSYTFTIALRNEPWQWTYKPGTQTSYLQESSQAMYKDYKMRIEKAVSTIKIPLFSPFLYNTINLPS